MAKDIRIRFGQKVRKLRERKSWTQVVMAEKLGLDQSYLADLEEGRRNVSLLNLELIAKGFGLSISQLFSKV